MNYEQKYKNALERAKGLLEGMKEGNYNALEDDIIDIFPELKESENEKIRNFLIDFIKICTWTEKKDQGWPSREDCLAWLEKQKVTDEEIIFRPIAGTDIRIAAKQALEKIDIGKKVVLAFNGAYIPVNGKTVGEIDSEYDAWLEKQGENKKLDPDKVIAWLVANILDYEYFVKWFKKDFGL